MMLSAVFPSWLPHSPHALTPHVREDIRIVLARVLEAA